MTENSRGGWQGLLQRTPRWLIVLVVGITWAAVQLTCAVPGPGPEGSAARRRPAKLLSTTGNEPVTPDIARPLALDRSRRWGLR